MFVITLGTERLTRAKFAYTTRHIRPEALATLLIGELQPRAGDLVLARIDTIGQHTRIEGPDGRRATLFPGDEIVVCYGNRYAPHQFEAEIPLDLSRCHLVAAGGVAARMLSKHIAMDDPTTIVPVGLLGDREGKRLNLADWAIAASEYSVEDRPPTIAVIGTTMNSGKTWAAAGLVRGLVAAERSVGAAKVTGTGAGGDVWMLTDAGANPVLDFTSAGHASTYRITLEDALEVLHALVGNLTAAEVDAIVLELADGIYQDETEALIASSAFARAVDAIVFASRDALGAVAGVAHLRSLGLPVVGVSGVVTAAPLGIRETCTALDLPVLDPDALAEPSIATALLAAQPIPAVPNGHGAAPHPLQVALVR